MTLILGARCRDGVILAADRRRLARYEKGPDTRKIFKLDCGVLLAGAGDDAVLNEAQVFIERRVEEIRSKSPKLFDIAEITAGVVNELVGLYRDKAEESFGFVLAGLEDLTGGKAKLYTIFGAGLSDVPLACIGSGSSYARPLVDLLLAGDGFCDVRARPGASVQFETLRVNDSPYIRIPGNEPASTTSTRIEIRYYNYMPQSAVGPGENEMVFSFKM
jgi:predicted proteasome-type protease